jgi:hypothetical protein
LVSLKNDSLNRNTPAEPPQARVLSKAGAPRKRARQPRFTSEKPNRSQETGGPRDEGQTRGTSWMTVFEKARTRQDLKVGAKRLT